MLLRCKGEGSEDGRKMSEFLEEGLAGERKGGEKQAARENTTGYHPTTSTRHEEQRPEGERKADKKLFRKNRSKP